MPIVDPVTDTIFLSQVGMYTLVYQFYQPNDPSFHMEVNLSVKGEIITTKVVQVPHCAANSGCRLTLLHLNAVTGIFGSAVTVSIKVPKGEHFRGKILGKSVRLGFQTHCSSGNYSVYQCPKVNILVWFWADSLMIDGLFRSHKKDSGDNPRTCFLQRGRIKIKSLFIS